MITLKKMPKAVRKESLVERKNLRELTRNPKLSKGDISNLSKLLKGVRNEISDTNKRILREKSRKFSENLIEENIFIDEFFDKIAGFNHGNNRLRNAFAKMMTRRKIEKEINKIRNSNIKKEEKRKREEELRKLKDTVV